MATAALIIYLVWAALAFGLRSWVQWRRTGDAGFRGSGLRPGSMQWWVRLLFTSAMVIGAAGPIAALAGLAPIDVLDRPVVQVAGAVLALGGVAATLAAQTSMGASWRIGVDEAERTALVTTGAFALARNPIFTAMMATATGLTAMVPNPVSLFGLLLTVLAIQLQVRVVEEPYLQRVHGDAYARYAAAVGRFLPGLGHLRSPLRHRPHHTPAPADEPPSVSDMSADR
ncbi:Protein-S-isoprenylcysteine O-methyltransferase Ste14 [Thermomonospora echinospora]|uniref:Protein-S-isoprenylcysteine O-methyltransferase Ste14 n=1 Tax=Thermomonospora echinospora TaxID=1992 RepID=A0A1H6AHG4_9ACTN|nr:isoprenylcysteine carboxylmethyltransferase family protein [Thermomonospora echinospora]SEG47951.1 Protein-S-isoprenylcysteine O-methyltransferase Ste14 [Thermomonospora echinospora]